MPDFGLFYTNSLLFQASQSQYLIFCFFDLMLIFLDSLFPYQKKLESFNIDAYYIPL